MRENCKVTVFSQVCTLLKQPIARPGLVGSFSTHFGVFSPHFGVFSTHIWNQFWPLWGRFTSKMTPHGYHIKTHTHTHQKMCFGRVAWPYQA